MRPEGGPEFFPSNNMIGGQHGTIIISPDAGGATVDTRFWHVLKKRVAKEKRFCTA